MVCKWYIKWSDKMKCKYLTLKTKKGTKYYYCKLNKKEVSFSCYKECDNKELSSINKTTDYLQKYKVSEDYSKEIQNKTSKNIENMTNIEMTPIENVLELKQNGGYRTNEEIDRLINNVKKNGI